MNALVLVIFMTGVPTAQVVQQREKIQAEVRQVTASDKCEQLNWRNGGVLQTDTPLVVSNFQREVSFS